MSDPEKLQEFIIIKRGNFEEEGHHGGAWKIAFADFMTAMMALFLVLWLINAANEETKKAVASYFNPVKLVDRNRSVKGLHDAEGVQEIETKVPNEQYPEDDLNTPVTESSSEAEAQFFADPFSVLDEIAAHEAPGMIAHVEQQGGRDGNQAINDAQGGQSFMDPFSPNFWNEEVRPSNDGSQLNGRYDTTGEFEALDDDPRSQGLAENQVQEEAPETGAGADEALETAALPMEAGSGPGQAEDVRSDSPNEPEERLGGGAAVQTPPGETSRDAAPDAEAMPAEATDMAEAVAEDLRREIGESLEEALGEDVSLTDGLTIVARDDGILISLTDGIDISMYGIGSAVPSRDLVIALEKIGGILASQDGGIRIRGHTDARPFRSDDYDNWRLSSARAQSAYYMLLRGGVDEVRVREISGFADRELLDPDNPLSPRNRRIEVLVEVPGA